MFFGTSKIRLLHFQGGARGVAVQASDSFLEIVLNTKQTQFFPTVFLHGRLKWQVT